LSAHQTGAREWIAELGARLERVRVVHGAWDRCLNHHYGDAATAVFLDPPYLAYESLYAGEGATPVAREVETWAKENARLRIALCGHDGDYDLPGWECFAWERDRLTYGGGDTKEAERIWFSPTCARVRRAEQMGLFA
jgi:16S rRNA G966 N2-methylase RsmD